MRTLQANTRKEKSKAGKEGEEILAVLYGPGIKETQSLEVSRKEFEKVFAKAGESALISLEISKKQAPVFIYDVQKDPLSGRVMHIDFYQPSLEKKMQISVPLKFVGEPTAVKALGGTLIKNIGAVEVRGLPQDLPHEIVVEVGKLATFEEKILLKDLIVAGGLELVGRQPQDIVAQVVPPEKVEEELATPVEEKVEEVEKVEKPKKEEEVLQEKAQEPAPKAQ